MNTTRTEGIVLQVVKYGEQNLIIRVFTAEEGLLSMFLAGGLSRKGKNRLPMEPLTHAEFIYSNSRGELLRCREVTVLDQFRYLRERYALLETAGVLVDSVLKSHWTQQPAPSMYALFKMYLSRLKEFKDYPIAASSLQLKIMRYEGLFSLKNLPVDLDDEERDLILVLAYGRSFATISQMVGTGDFHAKVRQWFEMAIAD